MSLIWGRKHAEFDIPNEPLKVAITPYPPFVYPCAAQFGYPHELCPYPGIDIELLFGITAALNITTEQYLVPSVDDWGTISKSGEVTGLFRDINIGSYDTAAVFYGILSLREPYLDYSYAIPYANSNPNGFVLRKPSTALDTKTAEMIFHTFTVEAWFTISLCFVIASIVNTCAVNLRQWVYKGRQFNNWRDFNLYPAWEALEVSFGQDYTPTRSSPIISENLSTLLLGFTALFFTLIFSSSLIESLLTSLPSDPFRSTTELAELLLKGDYKLISDSGAGNVYWWQKVQDPRTYGFKRANMSVEQQPPIIEPNRTRILEMLEADPTLVYPGQDQLGTFALISGHCDLVFIIDEDDASVPKGFIFGEGSPWAKVFQRHVIGTASMLHLVEEKYMHAVKAQFDSSCPPAAEKGSPMRLLHYEGSVWICFILIVAAFAALLAEKLLDAAARARKSWALKTIRKSSVIKGLTPALARQVQMAYGAALTQGSRRSSVIQNPVVEQVTKPKRKFTFSPIATIYK